jgi:hypothetical protein
VSLRPWQPIPPIKKVSWVAHEARFTISASRSIAPRGVSRLPGRAHVGHEAYSLSEADTPEDPRYGADARWQVFGETFKATPREQLETHSETSLETRTRPVLRLFGDADK